MLKAKVVINRIILRWNIIIIFDIFNATIDFQLQELNSRFCERAIKLLTLSSTLNPNDAYKSFNSNDICSAG
jgi:hypothetical protein